MFDYSMLYFLLPAVFFAGLVDSIAGGGGLISLPAYLAAGLPPHYALGNNKFSSSFGTLFATLLYRRSRMIDMRVALVSGFFALIGSFVGTRTVLLIKPDFLRYILIFLIPIIAVFTVMKKDFGKENQSFSIEKQKKYLLASLASLIIGFYDGFFGPGTGSFLILFYTIVLKYDLAVANGNTKVVNLASNIAALVAFLLSGKVIILLGVFGASAGILGNIAGAKLAIKNGSKIIKPVFVFALILLFIKILYDIFISH